MCLHRVSTIGVSGGREVDRLRENDNRCPRCWGKYKLDVRPRPVSIRSWEENGRKVTNRKYVSTCGCSWERTTVERSLTS